MAAECFGGLFGIVLAKWTAGLDPLTLRTLYLP